MGQPFALMVLFVDPHGGSDRGSGSQTEPFQTITHALTVATPGIATLQLSQGTYSVESGEAFPLRISAGVTVRGHNASHGRGIVIVGGGTLLSADFGKQCVAVSIENGATLQGITITNPHPGGTGVWVEGDRATITHCTIEHCTREGVLVTGSACVEITSSLFQHNRVSGLSMVRRAKGAVQDTEFRHSGYGLVIGDRATPLVLRNRFLANRIGVVLARSAAPVLRHNHVEANTKDGVLITDAARPNLGHPQDPGQNRFYQNGGLDIRHLGSAPLMAAGNELAPIRVQGPISFAISQIGPDYVSAPREILRPPAPFVAAEAVDPTPLLPALVPVRSALPSAAPSATADHWAAPYLRALAAQGIGLRAMQDPALLDQPVTRAEYAAMLCRVLGLPTHRRLDFQDLPEGDWAESAIATAVMAGFLLGFPDGSIRPQQPLPRWAAIASVVNGLKLTGGDLTLLSYYRDRAEIPSDGAIAIAAATQRQLVVNYPEPDRLRPLEPLTHGELATLMHQLRVITLQTAAIPSPYWVIPEPIGVRFSDLVGHWAGAFIQRAVDQGIMTGYADGTFRPNVPITRADLAVLLAALFNRLPERTAPLFKDVAPDFWAANPIARAFRLGLMSEFDDQTFRPHQTVSRLHLILALVNGLELPLNTPSDEIEAPSYARSAIASAIAHRLVVSFPDPAKLELNRIATRAEAAAMLHQTLVLQQRSPALASPFVVNRSPTTQSPNAEPLSVIVLDAGHGGDDSGIIGSTGFFEKDITLALCQAIAATLRQQPQLRVVMTRIDDRKLSNQQRLHIAQRAKANILISVHLSTTDPPDPSVNGLCTRYLETSDAGLAIAQSLHMAILGQFQVADRGIVSARFPLLRLAPMPAVQLEVGYATGRDDSQRLVDPAACTQLAEAIAHSIQQLAILKA